MPNLRTWEVEIKNQPQPQPHEAQAQNKKVLLLLFFKSEAQGWEYGSVVSVCLACKAHQTFQVMMAHAWITAVPELRRLRQKEDKFQTSIGYKTRHVKIRQRKPKRTMQTGDT